MDLSTQSYGQLNMYYSFSQFCPKSGHQFRIQANFRSTWGQFLDKFSSWKMWYYDPSFISNCIMTLVSSPIGLTLIEATQLYLWQFNLAGLISPEFNNSTILNSFNPIPQFSIQNILNDQNWALYMSISQQHSIPNFPPNPNSFFS